MQELLSKILIALLPAVFAVPAGAADLDAFVRSHRRAVQLGEDGNWVDAARVYGEFARRQPEDLYASTASLLEGVILRRNLNKPEAARDAFRRAKKAPDGPLGKAISTAATVWLARLRMEPIDAALRKYYVDEVEYPEKLEELIERKLLDAEQLEDPWGDPFEYKAGRLSIARKIPRQSYSLKSRHARGDSKRLKRILEESRAFERRYLLKAVTGVEPLKVILARRDKPNKPLPPATEGSKVGSATVVHVTKKAVVLADQEYIAVCAR